MHLGKPALQTSFSASFICRDLQTLKSGGGTQQGPEVTASFQESYKGHPTVLLLSKAFSGSQNAPLCL